MELKVFVAIAVGFAGLLIENEINEFFGGKDESKSKDKNPPNGAEK